MMFSFTHPFTKDVVNVAESELVAEPSTLYRKWDHEEVETLLEYETIFLQAEQRLKDNPWFKVNYRNVISAIEYYYSTILDRFDVYHSTEEKDALIRKFGYYPGSKELIRHGYAFDRHEHIEDLEDDKHQEFYDFLSSHRSRNHHPTPLHHRPLSSPQK